MASAQDAEDALVDAVIFFVGSEAGDARAPVLQSYSGGYSGILLGFRDITITSGLQTD